MSSLCEFESEIKYVLIKFAELSEHNHPTEEGENIAQ